MSASEEKPVPPQAGSKTTHRGGTSVDAVTVEVLGIGAFMAQVRPRSEAARDRWSVLASASFLRPEARTAELDRLRDLDQSISDSTIEAVARDLASLPPLERLTRRLDADEMLRDADFFELKRFLYYAGSILKVADGLDGLPSGDSTICVLLEQVMKEIHPEQSPSARFHLADELDSALEQSRSALRKVRRAFKTRRRALESEIVARCGGKFDIHGRFRPDEAEPGDEESLERQGSYYRLVDPELQALDDRLAELADKVGEQENRQRRRLTRLVDERRDVLYDIRERLIDFDLRIAGVELRRRIGGCWPGGAEDGDRSADQPWLALAGGRNPLLVDTVGPEDVQAVDLELREAGTVVIGPNMGGKSALLKLIGLVQWCAQLALPVPATRCENTDFERIVYVGSDEPGRADMEDGLSSFGREVQRFVDYWDGSRPTLWLLDEPGRGTHPEEGARLAEEIALKLVGRGDRVVMATHFPRLAAIDGFARLQIVGLDVDDQNLRKSVSEAKQQGRALTAVLRRFMDYGVIEDPDFQVPRDARRVAAALGLKIDESGD